ncbi:hypothetical protein D3C75_587220 [compost metagenome]
MSKKVGIALLCLIVLMVGLAYAGYKHHQKTSTYKYRAMAYMKKFEPSISFEYVDETPDEYFWFAGRFANVHLRDVRTGEIWTVGFYNGRLMPVATPSTPLSELLFDVNEEREFTGEIIGLFLLCTFLVTVCLAYVGYGQHRRTSTYIYKALAYMKNSDPSMNFEYLDQTPERRPDRFGGVVATVHIRNVSTDTIWAVEFLSGRVNYTKRVDGDNPEKAASIEKTD